LSSDRFDQGLLSPLAAGHDGLISDEAVLDALVDAELGLVRAWAAVGALPRDEAESIAEAWGRDAPNVAELAERAVAGGNPVIPLVPLLKQKLPQAQRGWVHRGATSQDILDTALMLIARRAVDALLVDLAEVDTVLLAFASHNRDVVAAGRTLAGHAVPTTVGRRAAGWLTGIRRATSRLQSLTLPAQLGGAAGTRASFQELGGSTELPRRFAESLELDDVAEVWHTSRWPVTELGDALTQLTDALGKLAGDVVTLSRTEIAELSTGIGGTSSAMPQKSNPVAAVLLRSAALRAPQLAATLHLCAALADDERPTGAWHAEWPTLRELLRLGLGASAHARELVAALEVDRAAVARNLALTRGLIVAERVSLVLSSLIGPDRVAALVAAAASGGDFAELIGAIPEASGIDVAALVDPAGYTGEAGAAVDRLNGVDAS
jgi:3-carboxy-cis,cis-muconate cycloisomerase